MLDPVRNFAKVTVLAGHDADDVVIELSSGEGALLPDPAVEGEYNLVWYNDTDYGDPTDDPTREIVRATALAGDFVTVTRAQEGTTATVKNATGKTYKFLNAVTKKMMDDIRTQLSGSAWVMDSDPTGAVNGINLDFTIAANASAVIVYADGVRVKSTAYTFTPGNDTIQFVNGQQPFSTLSVDYLPE